MPKEHEDLPELEELEPVEELEELEEIQGEHPSGGETPPASPAAGARTPAAPGGQPPPVGSVDRPTKKPGEKRELERAPQLLRGASKILIAGAVFPFFTALKPEFTAWAALYGGKALAAIACWVLYQGYMATHGGKPVEFVGKLAAANKFVPMILAALIAVGSIVPAVQAGAIGPIGGEIATLILGGATLVHIWGYEHGGKFNPIFPLMFLGPGIAGLLNVFGAVAMFGDNAGRAALGLLGSVTVAAGGLYAMYVMYQSIKEAKVEGERKKEEMRLYRKAQREAQKAARGAKNG